MPQAPPQEIIEKQRAAKVQEIESGEPVVRAFVAKMGEVDDDKRIIPFVLSTASVDREQDSINVDGWDIENYEKNPVVLWCHNSRILPIGRNLNTRIEDGKLKADTQFIGEDETTAGHFEFVESVYRLYKNGFMSAKSVGFRPIKWAWNEDRGYWAIDYESQELLEDSCVPVPANPEALVEARSVGINTLPIAKWAAEFLDTLPIDDATRRKVFEETWKHGKEHAFFQRVVADLEAPKKSAGNGLSVDLNLDFGDSFERLDLLKGRLLEVGQVADEVAVKTSAILGAPTRAIEEPTEEPPAAEDTTKETNHEEEPNVGASVNPEDQPVLVLIAD